MANVQAVYQLKCQQAYERDGFQEMTRALAQSSARFQWFADNLKVAIGAGSGKLDVSTNATAKLYAISFAMPSTATTTTWIQMFNTSSASVTLGTTVPNMTIELLSTDSLTTPILFPAGKSFGSGFSIAGTTTQTGSAAANASNTPVCTIHYA